MSSLSQVLHAALDTQELRKISRDHLPAMFGARPGSVTWSRPWAGFGVWGLLPAQLIPGWILPAWSLGRGMGEFAQSHGLSSGLKWNLVLMGGRRGILALLAPGFPGKTQQKSQAWKRPFCVPGKCGELCFQLCHDPLSLSQPSWECLSLLRAGRGDLGHPEQGHNSLWGSGGSWAHPRAGCASPSPVPAQRGQTLAGAAALWRWGQRLWGHLGMLILLGWG